MLFCFLRIWNKLHGLRDAVLKVLSDSDYWKKKVVNWNKPSKHYKMIEKIGNASWKITKGNHFKMTIEYLAFLVGYSYIHHPQNIHLYSLETVVHWSSRHWGIILMFSKFNNKMDSCCVDIHGKIKAMGKSNEMTTCLQRTQQSNEKTKGEYFLCKLKIAGRGRGMVLKVLCRL